MYMIGTESTPAKTTQHFLFTRIVFSRVVVGMLSGHFFVSLFVTTKPYKA